MSVAAILLAAGRLNVRDAVRSIAQVALGSRCDETCVVLGANADRVLTALDRLPIAVAIDEQWREGVAPSIRCGIAWARGSVGSRYGGFLALPAAFGSDQFPALSRLTGDHGARDLLHGAATVDWSDETPLVAPDRRDHDDGARAREQQRAVRERRPDRVEHR